MQNPELYQAILDRFSVRQFEQEVFRAEEYDLLRGLIDGREPLRPNNHISFLQFHEIAPVDLLVAQGPYGAFITSPHVLLPYTTSQQFPLLEVGFQTQQIVIGLFKAGIGSCYLGTAGRERIVTRHFELPLNAQLGASLVIGYPKNMETRTVANYFRQPGGKTKRMEISEFFYVEEFGQTGEIPASLKEVLAAAQRAPSAVNAQPWRFVLHQDWLYLYVMPGVYPFVLNQRHKNTYALHDAGIVMANIWLAYQAMGERKNWALYDFHEGSFPNYPKDVLPVAKIQVN